jgi:hypothetical protein
MGRTGPIARVENSRLERRNRPYDRGGNAIDRRVVVVVISKLIDRTVKDVGGEIAMSDRRGRDARVPERRLDLWSANARTWRSA